MIKVYQKIIDADKGDCLSACTASLFELPLEEVPNFFYPYGEEIEDYEKRFWQRFIRFIKTKLDIPYFMSWANPNAPEYVSAKTNNFDCKFDSLKEQEGIGGLFLASVYSPKYWKKGQTHAVIIDKDFNIVHDPNPNYKDIKYYPFADEMGYNGILDIIIFGK